MKYKEFREAVLNVCRRIDGKENWEVKANKDIEMCIFIGEVEILNVDLLYMMEIYTEPIDAVGLEIDIQKEYLKYKLKLFTV